jgi:predicted component of type VI protein secretion system
MGLLRNAHSGVSSPMPTRMLVGRSPTCFLRLHHPHVSGEHALLSWADTSWTIRDLASRNGTCLDSKWLDPRESMSLCSGAKITFGAVEETWIVEDVRPPDIIAMDLASQDVCVAHHGLLALSSDADPRSRSTSGAVAAG